MPLKIQVVDSHTGGEPTRVVLAGGPDLGTGPIADRCQRFRLEADDFRSAVINEPRGSDVWVGALLVPPVNPECVAAVIFFNNVSTLGMCGHGTIGVAVTLAQMGRIGIGAYRLETPVGEVSFVHHGNQLVSVTNVPSYRYRANVRLEVPGLGALEGEIAWGGNWFFLTRLPNLPLDLPHVEQLTEKTWRIREALDAQGITGAYGAVIDHIELTGPACDPHHHGRNFVLCPGGAYDRSPCGTGTSAKMACLAAAGQLGEGEPWRQESVIGSVFTGTYRLAADQPDPAQPRILPTITGSAYLIAESTLMIDPADPLAWGIRGQGLAHSRLGPAGGPSGSAP